jgi:TetR/AcrR family transcriptional regulator, transcriptional repressor of bet genes
MPKLGMGPIRRAQIFRAATEVIARESFSGTTLKKVADAAGVSTGTVNHYFSNKRAMLIETLAHIAAEWNESIVRTVDGAEPGIPRLKTLVEAAGPRSSINKLRWKVWMAAWGESLQSSELRTALRRSRHDWTDILVERIELINKELGGPKIDAREVAMVYDGLQNGLFVRMVSAGGPDDRQINDILFNFLIDRIGPKPAVGATAAPVASARAAPSRRRASAAAAPGLDDAAARDKAG